MLQIIPGSGIRRCISAPISLESDTDPCYLGSSRLQSGSSRGSAHSSMCVTLLGKQHRYHIPDHMLQLSCLLSLSSVQLLVVIRCAFTMAISFPRLSMSDGSSENDESDRLMEKSSSVESLLPPTRNTVAKVFTWGRLYSLVLHIVCVSLIIALWMSRQQSSYAAALRGRSWCKSIQSRLD